MIINWNSEIILGCLHREILPRRFRGCDGLARQFLDADRTLVFSSIREPARFVPAVPSLGPRSRGRSVLMRLAVITCAYCGARRIEIGAACPGPGPIASFADPETTARETCEACEDVLYCYFSTRSSAGTLAERLMSYVRRLYGAFALVDDPDVTALFSDPSRIPEVAAAMEESEALAEVIRGVGRPACLWIEPNQPNGCAARYMAFVAGVSGLELFELVDSTALRAWFDRGIAAAQDLTPDGRPL